MTNYRSNPFFRPPEGPERALVRGFLYGLALIGALIIFIILVGSGLTAGLEGIGLAIEIMVLMAMPFAFIAIIGIIAYMAMTGSRRR